MASFIDSPTAFNELARAFGLSQLQLDALHAADLTTLARLAFSCNYEPGTDDSNFRALLDVVFTSPAPTPGVMGSMRRLHLEAYTGCASSLSSCWKFNSSPGSSAPSDEQLPNRFKVSATGTVPFDSF